MKCFYIVIILTFIISSCKIDEKIWDDAGTNGIGETKILLGSSSALTGHAGFLGSQYLLGAQTYFRENTLTGGVHGRHVKVIPLDDQYNPSKTIANTQRLIADDKVFALFNYVGTPTSVAAKPIIHNANIPVFGFFTGAEGLRGDDCHLLYHLRDSYYAEAEGAVSYYVDKKNLTKIGVFYQEDAFGTAVLKGIQLALKKRGLKTTVTDTFTRGSLDIIDSVERINEADVEVVMMIGTYKPLAKFIKMTHELGNFPQFSTVSFVGSEAYSKELIRNQNIDPSHYKDVLVTQVVPSPYSEKFPAALEYLKLFNKYYPEIEPNYVAFEGFLNAKVIVLALQNAGRKLTRDGFLRGLNQIKNVDMGIEKQVSYGADDKFGLNGIYYSRLMPNARFEIFNPDEDKL